MRVVNTFLVASYLMMMCFLSTAYATVQLNDRTTSLSVLNGATFIANIPISGVKGRIVKEADATISGQNIIFDDGSFEDSGNIMELSGSLNLDSSSQIVLDGNKKFKGIKGQVLRSIKIQGSGNLLEGEPIFSSDVVLQDSNAELTVAIKGRFSQNIVLNGGKLTLDDDLYLLDDKMLTGSGRVYLNGRTLKLGSQDLAWGAPIIFYDAQDIELNSNLTLSETWTFSGSSTLNGNGNILFLDPGGNIVIEAGSTLLIKDITVRNISENNIRCLDDTSSLLLQNVNWVQDGNYSFTTGSIKFRNNVDFMGTSTFSYESGQTCTIDFQTHVGFRNGMTFKMGRKEADGNESLYAEDASSFLSFENASLIITASGAKVTSGTFTFHDDVNVEVNSTWTGNGLVVGDSSTPTDGMKLHFYPGSNVTFHSGHFAYAMPYPDGLVSRSTSAKLVRKAASVFDLQQDVVLPEISMDVSILSQFMLGVGVDLTYENTRFVLPDTEFDVTGTRANAVTTLLAGDDTIFMVRGVMPFVTYVTGQGNKIHGTGSVSGPIYLLGSGDELTVDLEGHFSGDISLNGGELKLLSNFNFDKSAKITGKGTVNISNNKMNLAIHDTSYTSTILWDCNNGKISFNSNISLSSTWSFNGVCTIEGNGNVLTLDSGAGLVVYPNSKLHLRNITLDKVSSNNIRCLDDSSSVVLDNVGWIQDGNYSFTKGSFSIKEYAKMSGVFTFAYQSSQTSTVESLSKLVFDHDFTFSYDPPIKNKTLITFADSSSVLTIKGATVHTTTTGLQFLKGKVRILGTTMFEAEAGVGVVVDKGITFGDQTLINDCVLEIAEGTFLRIVQGSLYYRNISQSSLKMSNIISAIHVNPGAALVTLENFHVGSGRLEFDEGSILGRATGKDIVGSIHIGGAITYKKFSSSF